MSESKVASYRISLDAGPAMLTLPDVLLPDDFDDLDVWFQGILRRYRRNAAKHSTTRPHPQEPADGR